MYHNSLKKESILKSKAMNYLILQDTMARMQRKNNGKTILNDSQTIDQDC